VSFGALQTLAEGRRSARRSSPPALSSVSTPVPSASPTDAAERRQLAVMFCDLVGSTTLSARPHRNADKLPGHKSAAILDDLREGKVGIIRSRRLLCLRAQFSRRKNQGRAKRDGACSAVATRKRIEPMPDKDLDPVEWELVRADIAMEKARLKANGDWSKWEEFQAQTNAKFASYARAGDWMSRAARVRPPMTEEERAVRAPELSGPIALPRRPRWPGWPFR
jgi:hypothetical protein